MTGTLPEDTFLLTIEGRRLVSQHPNNAKDFL